MLNTLRDLSGLVSMSEGKLYASTQVAFAVTVVCDVVMVTGRRIRSYCIHNIFMSLSKV